MTTFTAYLNFNGNCREAMTFYQKCLGGELYFQTLGDIPPCEGIKKNVGNHVLHSTLTCSNFVLMGSDMVGENGFTRGNTVSLLLNFSSESELLDCYQRLSYGGKQTYPPSPTFWGSLFGGLTDRFGNQWLLNYGGNKN